MTNSRKVVFLTGDLALGGGAMFVLNVCNGLRNSDQWQGIAGVFTQLGEVGSQMLEQEHLILGPFPKALIHEEYIESMYQACRKLQPRAVVANLGGETFDFLRFVPEGVLRVGIIHSDEEYVYQLVEQYLPWLDVVVGVSKENCRNMAKRLGGKKIPVVQVACGVPMPPCPPTRTPASGLRVLYLGRVAELQKRAGLLQRVIRKTLNGDPSILWTIAGDGPDLAGMRQVFADSPARVNFLGSLPYADVPALMADHDAYFLCSDYEGLPLSMLEAMGGGLVPVVSDLPSGISEVVHEGNGIRVPMHDEDAYVKALFHLANSREVVRILGRQAAEDVRRNYSIEAMANRWNNVLDKHVGQPDIEWPERCVADVPPTLQHRWKFHPRLRWFRKLTKPLRSRG